MAYLNKIVHFLKWFRGGALIFPFCTFDNGYIASKPRLVCSHLCIFLFRVPLCSFLVWLISNQISYEVSRNLSETLCECIILQYKLIASCQVSFHDICTSVHSVCDKIRTLTVDISKLFTAIIYRPSFCTEHVYCLYITQYFCVVLWP